MASCVVSSHSLLPLSFRFLPLLRVFIFSAIRPQALKREAVEALAVVSADTHVGARGNGRGWDY
jgi:hypothetical protein